MDFREIIELSHRMTWVKAVSRYSPFSCLKKTVPDVLLRTPTERYDSCRNNSIPDARMRNNAAEKNNIFEIGFISYNFFTTFPKHKTDKANNAIRPPYQKVIGGPARVHSIPAMNDARN